MLTGLIFYGTDINPVKHTGEGDENTVKGLLPRYNDGLSKTTKI